MPGVLRYFKLGASLIESYGSSNEISQGLLVDLVTDIEIDCSCLFGIKTCVEYPIWIREGRALKEIDLEMIRERPN
jgi:hypothetical protein